MNKTQYLSRLAELLTSQYANLKTSQKQSEGYGARIEGFMEAGLVASVVTQDELKKVINDSHLAVFGISLDDRNHFNVDAEHINDIPAWIRRGVQIKELKAKTLSS
ncbi:hypothetical protein J3998_12705 [Thiomicrorhabdus sp. 6S2-11]|uniref:Uncharacterized protein n=1 Tax=Thiomicrorhabdus marina TaxID=2818442 RepID=A0ABS3Q852_9GAMM|nr:hypothetical protein [Thiomicrorhabdus marina]MBO1928431.1 hypothetical protein [Thiomicrorhabdus marina]